MNDCETSDDDFIDPSMDKYFKPSKKESKKKVEVVEESESEEEEEEEEEEQDEDDSGSEAEEKDLNGNDKDEDDEDNQNDGRKQLTFKMIENWTEKLSVINLKFKYFLNK